MGPCIDVYSLSSGCKYKIVNVKSIYLSISGSVEFASDLARELAAVEYIEVDAGVAEVLRVSASLPVSIAICGVNLEDC